MPHRNCLQHDPDAENLLSKYLPMEKNDKKSKCIFGEKCMCGESVVKEKEEKIFIFKENLPLKLVVHISIYICEIDFVYNFNVNLAHFAENFPKNIADESKSE